MQKRIESFIKIIISASFFSPLVLVPSSFIFPFIVPKILFFRSLTLLMLGGYLILLLSDWHKYKFKITSMNIMVGLFFLSFVISTFAGVDWYKSFWDNHERMLGLFTIFHFVIYYFIATTIVSGWKEWKWLFRVFLCAGSAVMFLGLIQKFNPEFLINRGSGRVSATLGNAIYFSAYGMFLFFIGLLLFLKEENKSWKIYALMGSILGFWGVFGGGTRGSFLGLVAGIAVLALVYFFTLEGRKKLKFGFTGGIIILLIFLAMFRQSGFVRGIPLVGQVVNLNLKTDLVIGTIGSRIMAWGIAVESWKERPVFGWGPNNYYYAFNKFYKPEFLGHGWGETWFDNAHSALINTLSVQGIVGILSYLGIFSVPAYALILSYKKKRIDHHVFAASSAFLAGHFVHNFFVFENPTSYLYFFFFLAFINSSVSAPDTDVVQVDKNISEKRVSLGSSIAICLIILLFIFSTDINPARANMATLRTLQALHSNPAVGAEKYLEAASISSPHIDDIRNDFARSAVQLMTALLQNNKIEEAKKIFTLAYGELQKNRELHPGDIRVHIQQSQLAGIMAQKTNNVSFLMDAEKILEEALDYSPKRQQIQYMLSIIKLRLGKGNEAVNMLKDSVDNNPKIEESWWRLAMAYEENGEHAKAVETIKQAKSKGVSFSEQGNSVVSIIFGNEKKK